MDTLFRFLLWCTSRKIFDSKAHAIRFSVWTAATALVFLGFRYVPTWPAFWQDCLSVGVSSLIILGVLYGITSDDKVRDDEDYGGRGSY